MLMAATHMMMDSSSSASPPPWLPVLADHHHQLCHDLSASAPSPPPSHHHFSPRAAHANHRRVANKRRPRPSRRSPTTYISADPASFRRMVQQVTGADNLLPPPPQVLCRPAPSRNGATTTCHDALSTLLLPTLDTSAFLVGAAGALTRTSDASAAGLPAASPSAPTLPVEADNNNGSSSSSSCGLLFPTLESWDHHHATLF